MTAPRKYQRKQVIITPSFQLRLTLWAGVVAAAEIILTAMVMVMANLTSVWIPAGYHVGVFTRMMLVAGVCALVFTLVNIAAGVLVSHRIAGPVYRLKQSLRRIAAGDVSFLIHLREQDELQDLKDEFNDMISSLRERLKTLRRPGPRKKTSRQAEKQEPFPFKLD